MPPVGFEPTISAGERPQSYVLDCAATEIGLNPKYAVINITTGISSDSQTINSSQNYIPQLVILSEAFPFCSILSWY
jgi:hypothetical protein